MASVVEEEKEPLTQAEIERALERAPRCCVCGVKPPVVNRRRYDCNARGDWDPVGWMRLQYPIPTDFNAVSTELEWYCPKDAARAAGLLRELRAGNVRR